MATDVELEATKTREQIYSEPNADPYESELESVVDMHDYSALANVNDDNPCQTEVILSTTFDQRDLR